MKQLRQPIFYLQWTLIVFSIIAFGLATIDGCKLSFYFSSIGFKNYLKLFEPYSILFAATFIVITAHLAIERLGLMSDANSTAFKASNRTVWMQIVKEFFPEIKKDNPYICKELTKQLLSIHDYLFEKKYIISNRDETKAFFDKFFANKVEFFEEMNIEHMNIAFYRDEGQSYSWGAFRYIIIVMVMTDECYTKFIPDLREFYQQEVVKFSRKNINASMFASAKQEYLRRRREGTDLR